MKNRGTDEMSGNIPPVETFVSQVTALGQVTTIFATT